MDVEALEKNLPENYIIIYKEHSMGKYKSYNENVIVPNEDIDLQELILISDIVISDYSSIIFDAITINIPFYLYIMDFEKYSRARGIYEDLDNLLSPFYVNQVIELSEKIINVDKDYHYKDYNKIKKLYIKDDMGTNSNHKLELKIKDILKND